MVTVGGGDVAGAEGIEDDGLDRQRRRAGSGAGPPGSGSGS